MRKRSTLLEPVSQAQESGWHGVAIQYV